MGFETTFHRQTVNGVRLDVRATPGAAADEISGIWKGAEGETRLAVKVTAAPDKGKANSAIIKLTGRFRDKVVPGLSSGNAPVINS